MNTIPWLTDPHYILRCGEAIPLISLTTARLADTADDRALTLSPQAIVEEIKLSGLRGRGGAAFPTGIKWRAVLDAHWRQKYIVCNADEGDSGTFADRLLMEADPLPAHWGYDHLRFGGRCQGLYLSAIGISRAQKMLERAIDVALADGYLGADLCGSGQRFELEVRMGAGSYICGEETALLNSLEGKRGVVRAKPPLPAIEGLFAKPTVVNNVLTLASVSSILADGGAEYARHGVDRSKGTCLCSSLAISKMAV